ncbi:LPXTG-motif protein cell wall anchor domain protein [Gardnerella vaginalis JCP8151B]|nr:LPXTG-motif protein cell wall anchor domain protein [Gardnerella vaginalis JCP8151B]
MQPEKVNRYSLRKFGQHLVSAVVAVVVVGILSSGMALSQATLANADMVGKDNDLRNGSESSRTAGSANKTNPLTKDDDGYYDLMTEKTSENLYPEVFSNEELQKAEAEKDDKVKIYFTPKGKDFNPKGKDTKQLTLRGWRFVDWYPQEGTVDYFIFLPKRNVESARAQVGAVYHAFNTLEEGNKISFNDGKYAETPFSLSVNKKVLGENLKEETKFKVNPKQTRAFVRVSYQVTKNDDALSQVFYVDRYGEGNTIFKFFVTSVDADFHFVDDSSYRKLTNQKLSSPLKERSEKDKNSFSNEAFKKLDLKDMLDIVKTDKVFFGNNPVYSADLSTPLLSYQKDKKESIKRPTLEELKAKTIPGYIYCDNDIDKPKTKEFKKDDATTKEKGNHYLTYGYDENRNMLTTKHYYVTYRAIPTEIVVRQFKEDKKTPLDNSFDLYRVEDNKEVLVKSAIKPNHSRANEKEDAIGDIAKMMTKNTINDAGYYEPTNLLYLEPGNYVLKSKNLKEPYYNEKENQEFTVGLLDSSDKKTRIVVDFNAGLKHKVTYNFKSEDGKNLPDKVTNLLPKNENTYKKGEKITPTDPTQKEISVDGGKWTFLGYDAKEQTVGDKDLTFTGTWKFTSIKPLSTLDEAPQLEVADKEIMVGEDLDLKTLIISATDKEDGDLKEKVEIVDKGGFDNNKVGTYKITYKVADSKGATATKQATVTVKEKTKSNPEPQQESQQDQQPQPVTPTPQSEQQPQQEQQSNPRQESQQQSQQQSQPQPKPETQPQHKTTLPRTGTTVSSLVLMGSVLVAMGVLLQVSKRKD